ncbi:MAG: hypothetical protein RR842_12850, partial [Gordonibacter sp.]|uniref:hypothetical protein n=1 Tax=Gordonibacter sp. TaxID=1968902 RepID=UPI002FCAE0B2
SGTLTLIKDAESMQTAFNLCEGWKARLKAMNFDFLSPHYRQTYKTICSGSPASYLMYTVSSMKKDAIYYETQIKGYREAVDDLLTKESLLTEQNTTLQEELASLVNSRAFRFGTAALRIPSKIKEALRGLKN